MAEYADLSEKVTVIFHDHGTEEMGKRTVTIKYILDKCCCDGYTVLESAQPEIVRCKDCALYNKNDCYWNEYERRNPDDFCSRGVRREDE